MTTLGDLRGQVLRVLGDLDGVSYSKELTTDAIIAAHKAILPWVPKVALGTVTGDGTDDYAVPEDLYEIEAIVDQATGEILPQAILRPGLFRGESLTALNDWIEYPEGFLTFSKALETGTNYDLFYLAYWVTPEEDDSEDFELTVPASVLTGMGIYSAAYCLLPEAIGTAEIRQFATDPDRGHPEHNPLQKSVDFLLRLFNNEMNRLPKQQRAEK